MSKYKFILSLPFDCELASAEGPGQCFAREGIFDSREEASARSADFKLYKYVLYDEDGPYYNSFEDEVYEDTPRFYFSVFDADNAAYQSLENEEGDHTYEVLPIEIESVEIAETDESVSPSPFGISPLIRGKLRKKQNKEAHHAKRG